MKNLKKYALYIGIGVIGILIGALIFGGHETQTHTMDNPDQMDQHVADNHTDENGEVVYYCSMHPSVRQNEPGDCPICSMELIPEVSNSSTSGNPNELTMSLAAMKLAEIETSVVRSGNPVSTIYLPGKVMPDQNKVSSVTSHSAGRIIKLYVDFVGAFVKEGQKIASLYSPELISAQQEFLQTVEFKDQNPVLYKSAKKKLELLELPTSTIENIEKSGEIMTEINVVSQATGYVTKLNVTRQEHVKRGTVLFEVVDLSSVWVMFDAYESDLSLIEEGQRIMFTTATYPGEKFEGTVSFVDPSVNNMSRTADVRVKASNPDKKLKPNMLAEGILTAKISKQKSLLVPKSAVLWTGPRSIVFVELPNTEKPTFMAREVTLGKRVGNEYIILEGLETGEKVVTHGNFKLDGAAQLADKFSMMNRMPGTGANRTGHEGHTMGAGDSGEMQMEMNPSAMKEESMNMKTDEQAQDKKEHSHDAHLASLISEYMEFKNALVDDDFEKAQKHILSFSEEVNSNNEMNEHKEHQKKHKTHHAKMLAAVEIATASKNIEELRNSLEAITLELVKAVENQGYDKSALYVQFCPMANNGEGANWLSKTKKIANPYFGQEMHKCGATVEKLNGN